VPGFDVFRLGTTIAPMATIYEASTVYRELVMASVIRLTLITGPNKGRRFCIRERCDCLVGRARECQVHLEGIEVFQRISRRHCELFFDPPQLRVRDLGSRNGTYINGRKLGEQCDVFRALFQCDRPLGIALDTDFISIGGSTIQVHVMDCPLACSPQAVNGVRWEETEVVKEDCPLACR
jgi:pSer/pThr/pTyr-binding forkhead associated (FHA) protein